MFANKMKASDHILKDFGNKLRELRKAKGWSQSDLSHEVEMESSHISRLELGKAEPGLITILSLSVALECDPAELVNINLEV
jgi:transcriptional regulator with XRE-family HTH domain